MITQFFIPPEDLYLFQVCGVQDKKSSATGRDYTMLSLRIAAGPYTGNILYKPVLDTDRARFIWSSWVDTLEQDLIGKWTLALVRHENYGGELRAIPHQFFSVPEGLTS